MHREKDQRTPPPQTHLVGIINELALDAACTAGLKASVVAPGIYRDEIKAAVTAYLSNAAVVDFSRLYTHPLAKQFHEAIQTVDNLGCDTTSVVCQIKSLAKAVEQEINRLSSTPDGDVTEDMLNEGQERMCQMASRTIFDDHIQAEIYKAMRTVDPAFRAPPPETNLRGLTLASLQRSHVERQEEWCPDQKPDLSFRGNELGGECGEAQNVIKKLERERLGWRGSRDTVEHLAEELADVIHCAVLCAITAGIDIEPAVVAKFNSTSEKNNLSTLLATTEAQS